MWRGSLLLLPDTRRWAVGILQVGRGWILSSDPCDQSVSLLSPPRWSQGTQLPVATSEPKLAHLLSERSTGFRDRVYPQEPSSPPTVKDPRACWGAPGLGSIIRSFILLCD